MEKDLNIPVNGFFLSKCKTTSFSVINGRQPQFLSNGRQPPYSGGWETTSILSKSKKTIIFENERLTQTTLVEQIFLPMQNGLRNLFNIFLASNKIYLVNRGSRSFKGHRQTD
jgi:hypothetical protein